MAEYLIQGETLESVADKIRILNGVEGGMTPAQMDSNLGDVNTEVGSQADLIAQITSALEGKAAGGSGGDISEGCGIQWISCGTLQTTYSIAPGSQMYYIELPHENCFVLFFSNTYNSGCRIGCYDVKARAQTLGCHSIYHGDMQPDVIEDNGVLYLQLYSSTMPHTAYYAIISEASLP